MEGVLCKTLPADIQKESSNLGINREVLVDSKTKLSSKEIPLDKNLETQKEKTGVNGHYENGPLTVINGESPKTTETANEKTYSPTLIGSAIQAVKNLFSPDKTKAKAVSVLSPINQQRSASGSPRSSIYIPGKADIFSSEAGMDIFNSVQSVSGESEIKSNLQITDLGSIRSPLAFEPQNSTDDSFLTTASLIDDSFHSAVTHLDEHGEAFKNGINFMDSLLNNSQNLDLVDPYNETLENESYFLENTTLKLGSLTYEGSKMCNVSILDTDGNGDNLNGGSGKVQNDVAEENVLNGSTHLGGSKEGSPRNLHQSPGVHHEMINENVEMAHLFLNKPFEDSTALQQNEVEIESNKVVEKESGVTFEVPINVDVEKSISTTTIVLNSAESVDLDVLSNFKADELGVYIPSSGFLEGCSSSEDVLAGNPSNGSDSNSSYKQSTECSSSPTSNFSSLCQEKKCLSEGNSPNHGLNPNKIKLNKSDEMLNRRILNESVEGKRIFQDNNHSVDISLIKNSEASKITKESHPFHEVAREIGESESPTNKSNPVAVFSQQSYTILTKDNSLNRPVIEPVNACKEKEIFLPIQSDRKLSENIDKSSGKNSRNMSFSAEELGKSSEVKQSTPIWEGNNDGGLKFFRPTALKLLSPEGKKHLSGDTKANVFRHSDPIEISPVNPVDQAFPTENDMDGSCYSLGYDANSTRNLPSRDPQDGMICGDVREAFAVPILNQTFDKKELSPKNVADKPNQTFLKKSPTKNHAKQSEGHMLNQTFDKTSPKPKSLNSTFTSKRDSGEIGRANQTFDISTALDAHVNKTYDKPQLNETFDKQSESPVKNKTKILESPTRQSQAFIEGMENGRQVQELNKTFDKNEPVGETPSGIERNSDAVEKINKLESAKNSNDSFSSAKSSNTSVLGSDLSTVVLGEELNRNRSIDDLSEKLDKMVLEGNDEASFEAPNAPLSGATSPVDLQTEEKLLNSLKECKMGCDADLVQLIQEQFSPKDIEKICNVVQDFSMKLSNDIMRAGEQFDKSFHGNLSDAEFKPPEEVFKPEKPSTAFSPESLDFLNSIRGKPTGRDLSRESLYVKFDPLLQPTANSLIDFTKEAEAILESDAASPSSPHSTSVCEQLLTISPQKKPDEIVPPLNPRSSTGETDAKDEKTERLKELQNEIYFLKNLYAERERMDKAKMENLESQIPKLTREISLMMEKLKASKEREIVLKEQSGELKIVLEEYVKTVSRLTGELEILKKENTKQTDSLSVEKDYYMTHIQNTEAAFMDLYAKYEKSKKAIMSLKTNEAMYKNLIAEQRQKLEDLEAKMKESQRKALADLQKVEEELNETRANHAQKTSQLKSKLRKAELRVEVLQESLEQKIKENQQITAMCDDLIEGRK